MAKFCTGCGKEMPDGMLFCTECGTKVLENATEVSVQEAVIQAPPPPPKSEPTPPPVQPPPVYQPPVTQAEEKFVKTSTYFWLMFLFGIPVIGFIMTIIMAFAPKNKSLKNFAKAILIWVLIGVILLVIIGIVMAIMGNSLMAYIGNINGLEGLVLQ